MTVVTFLGYQPLVREDGMPWTKAKIYESDNPTAGFILIETKTFADPDVDPANPKIRNFTTELATLEQGWYKVIFEDATGDTSPTAPIHNIPDPAANFLPLVSDVGAILRARTKDTMGNELGTFTSATRPTYADVLPLIAFASRRVTAKLDTDIPESLWKSASSAIALRTAMQIELTYWPEQLLSPRSAYQQLRDLYDEELADLLLAVQRETSEDSTGVDAGTGLSPSWYYPPDAGGLVGWRTTW